MARIVCRNYRDLRQREQHMYMQERDGRKLQELETRSALREGTERVRALSARMRPASAIFRSNILAAFRRTLGRSVL